MILNDQNHNHHLKHIIIDFVFGIFVTAVIVVILTRIAHLKEMTPAALRDYVQGFGKFAGLVYIIAYVFDTLALFPPMVGFAITAGLAFGRLWGCIYLMIAAMIGTTLAFLIARYFGRDLVERMLPKKFKHIDEKIGANGFEAVFFFRLVPIIPYEVLNYVSGLSKVRYRDYVEATFLGLIPGIIISVFFGDALGSVRGVRDILSWKIIFTFIPVALIASLPFVHHYYLKKKKRIASLSGR